MHSQLSSYLEGWIKTLAGHKDSSSDDEYSIDSDEGSIDNDEDPSDEDSSDRIQSDSDEDSSDGSLAFWVPPSCRGGLCGVEVVFGSHTTRLDLSQLVHGTAWTQCHSPRLGTIQSSPHIHVDDRTELHSHADPSILTRWFPSHLQSIVFALVIIIDPNWFEGSASRGGTKTEVTGSEATLRLQQWS